ncbi:aspartate dehydrogenase [Roseburia hominis]
MFRIFRKKEIVKKDYDRENQKPVIHCSICTGEQVAGFKDLHTGKFQDIMLIRNDEDLRKFKEMYGVDEITKEY